ncbi:MAG: cysteine desulfurase family protein [Candidatus Caldarchaeum sp.]
MERIYADHAATTPLDARVLDAMLPYLRENFHNPSSLYEGARRARMAVDLARDRVAAALGVDAKEVFFTSSGTESANMAILGTALAHRGGERRRLLFGSTEHHCVLKTEPLLGSWGYHVDFVPAKPDGRIDVEDVRERLGHDVLMVSVMHANNETGVLNPAGEIGALCQEYGALYHCDAVQTFGLLPVKPNALRADFVSLSAHKLYGPKGVGTLYIRSGVKPQPLLLGGAQERELRAGTENVAGIVGFGEAVKLAQEDLSRAERISEVRNAFVQSLLRECSRAGLPRPIFTGCTSEGVPRVPLLPGHAHFRIPGALAETMLINLDLQGVDASSGAACSSGSLEPSHVLLAMGFSAQEASEALRFSFGKANTLMEAEESARRVRLSAERVLFSRSRRHPH